MSKILPIIASIFIALSCFVFVACDYEKKYSAKDVSAYFNQMRNDENLTGYFNSNNELEISWSTQLQSEFNQSGSVLKSLEKNYAVLIETAFNTYVNFNINISNSWSKTQTTKVYNNLVSFNKSLKKFNSQKIALEESMANYVAGQELSFLQLYNYDVLVETSKKLINQAIKLGNNTLNGIINNNYEKFWTSAINYENPAWHYVKTVNLYYILELTSVAYEYDIKFSYNVLDRKFLFDTNITNKLAQIVELYKQKSAMVTSNANYQFSQDYINAFKQLVENKEKFNVATEVYLDALDKINVKKLRENKLNIPAYMDTLSGSEKVYFDIVNDYNAFNVTYIFGLMQQELELL